MIVALSGELVGKEAEKPLLSWQLVKLASPNLNLYSTIADVPTVASMRALLTTLLGTPVSSAFGLDVKDDAAKLSPTMLEFK